MQDRGGNSEVGGERCTRLEKERRFWKKKTNNNLI